MEPQNEGMLESQGNSEYQEGPLRIGDLRVPGAGQNLRRPGLPQWPCLGLQASRYFLRVFGASRAYDPAVHPMLTTEACVKQS